MNERRSGTARILIGLSMAIFGTIGLFVRAIPLPSSEVALYRAVLATAVIGLYLLITGQKIEFAGMRRELILLIISGMQLVGFFIIWLILYFGYKKQIRELNEMQEHFQNKNNK